MILSCFGVSEISSLAKVKQKCDVFTSENNRSTTEHSPVCMIRNWRTSAIHCDCVGSECKHVKLRNINFFLRADWSLSVLHCLWCSWHHVNHSLGNVWIQFQSSRLIKMSDKCWRRNLINTGGRSSWFSLHCLELKVIIRPIETWPPSESLNLRTTLRAK